ncbi:MAG: hypothetical protein F6K18_12770 [Okeania sp. SIO2C2]|uniref:hypothetical protein n=1 Tax=Okeania sp. SIO2C2 TaxID=2607787 RepID=UPI0013BAA9AD|nr:hypothetical protein [Okeania sp. SIO2C2]NEP87618.1 hypothetical protein [Okeania sp. SIO2C2]
MNNLVKNTVQTLGIGAALVGLNASVVDAVAGQGIFGENVEKREQVVLINGAGRSTTECRVC